MSRFHSLFFSDVILLFYFLLSHPLYFSYFLFFSPYILKLLSFLSPLFITTSLLLLVILFTVSPRLHHHADNKVSFFQAIYHAVAERSGSRITDSDGNQDDFVGFEELEAFKIVFDTSALLLEDVRDDPIDIFEVSEVKSKENSNSEANEVSAPEINWVSVTDEKKLYGFLKQLDVLEDSSIWEVEGKKIEAIGVITKPNKVDEKQEEDDSLQRKGNHKVIDDLRKAEFNTDERTEYKSKETEHAQKLHSRASSYNNNNNESFGRLDYTNLGSYGSMRKEKEWKRTLACKLFEERQTTDGSEEGMDLLWEAYELDSSKAKTKKEKKNTQKKNSRTKNKREQKQQSDYFDQNSILDYDDKDEEEEEEDDGLNGQKFCCLQAFKLSAGKMNLGMGRHNLVKISKAIKGIGWLHNVTKHGKKGGYKRGC